MLLVLAFALVAARAVAAANQEASFQDNRLLLADPAQLSSTLQTLEFLGVDRLRISVVWDEIAPAPSSRRKPRGFDAADPAAYSPAEWASYDTIAAEAAKYGMGVNFDLMGGVPLWAVGVAPARSMQHVWYPSAAEFGAFVRAVGTRYSGHYTPPGASAPLPRVNYWSIWNEPNVGSSSLSPQTVNGVEVGPRLYRSLLDHAYSALVSTGHRRDTILVGEMASTGHADPGSKLGMQPLRFLRALYCVDSNYRPLRGRAAAVRKCPTNAAGSRGFRASNPALFDATGWSHHPYHLTTAPDVASPPVDADWVTFADLPKLERALDRSQRAYGSNRRFPIYLTEYGFETNPPRPEFAISTNMQATYLNQSEYIAWRDPRVQTLSQYLLQDAQPGGGSPISSFASGLMFVNGTEKPSFYAYRLPVWIPNVSARRGHSLEVWGCVRPAKRYPQGANTPVDIQLNGQTVRSVTVTNRNGYFDVHVAFPHSGTVRLAWTYPGRPTIYSRSVTIHENREGLNPIVIVGVLGAMLIAGCYVFMRRFGRVSV